MTAVTAAVRRGGIVFAGRQVLTLASGLLNKAKGMFGQKAEAAPALPKKPVNLHHAVSIAPGPRACAAAHDLVRRRFLSREAPSLPLMDCNRTDCQCRYEHHEDRRKGPRRARDFAVSVDGHDGEEHRATNKRGRRKSDR